MKKRLLCLFLAVLCALPLMLTGCGEDDYEAPDSTSRSPMTITLYGITGDTTTAESIKAVEAEINEYTEGNFNTHIILRLYPEAEYYAKLNEAFEKLEDGEVEDVPATEGGDWEPVTSDSQTEAPVGTGDDAPQYGYGNYPEENGTQVDIFMVQGTANMYAYYEDGRLANLSGALLDSAQILNKYISARLLATTTIDGERQEDGSVKNGVLYGIPNNYVEGEYTYLLVHKELSAQYYYAEQDVNTLDGLANFLSDAVTHEDFITLYNEPTLNVETFGNTLLGAVIPNDSTAFTYMSPQRLLKDEVYVNYLKNLFAFRKAGYITEGDAHSLPVDENGNEKKVAAAFVKGNATLPSQYEDEYYVITYQKPLATSEQLPGTMFCVGSQTKDVNRCVEIITALQINAEFRNLFQYGVEGMHYSRDEYTGAITVTGTDYVMDPADTGNLFLLYPNASMSEEMLALAANNWELAKAQYRDTVHSPYLAFDFKVVSSENFREVSPWYKKTYLSAYNNAYAEKIAELKAEAKKNGQKFNEADFDEKTFKKEFEADYISKNKYYSWSSIAVALEEFEELSADILARIEAYDASVDGDWNAFLEALNTEMMEANAYLNLMDLAHPDSLLAQYSDWRDLNGVIGGVE